MIYFGYKLPHNFDFRSSIIIVLQEEKKPGRKYPWGVALARDSSHSDFLPLEQMLYAGYDQVCIGL